MITDDVVIGEGTKVFHPPLVNLYGCKIGANCKIGTFVEIQKNAIVGNNCKIQSHSFICEGVIIEDGVFVGHGVKFINDKFPESAKEGKLQTEEDWIVTSTLIKKGASLGTNSTILCGLTIGENSIVGAGSVVTKSVPPRAIVAGNPAKLIRFRECSASDRSA
jgi:UDP-2-acetamido-3-amino-2,3-dideoxy-glucuronate N-acetyltransferase